jgi:type I restriction enzyme S subunit
MGPKRVRFTREMITDLAIRNSNVKLIPVGTVLMSFKLTIGKLGIADRDLYTNEAICAFLPRNERRFEPEFLFQLLHVLNLTEEVDQAVKGKTLNKSKLSAIAAPLPPLKEQRAIASVLQDEDRYIHCHQRHLEELQAEKSALMQQLLTGKRRVTV